LKRDKTWLEQLARERTKALVDAEIALEKAKGTGLGLTICKQIIGMHGGEINVKRNGIKGTCVFLRLPKERNKKGT